MSKFLTPSDTAVSTQAPPDLAQVTILVDESGSMLAFGDQVRESLETVVSEFEGRDGAVVAVRTFNDVVTTRSEFGQPAGRLVYHPDGNTALYKAVVDTIKRSRSDAKLAPELKVHHVIVVITDGDNTTAPEYEDIAKAAIEAIDVDATFLLVDFSYDGNAGFDIGLKSVHIKDNTPAAFQAAMGKVRAALTKIVDNIVKQLPPAQNLCLPPAR